MPNRKGFTLVELMVVIGIIGTLVAIAVPSYQKYIARSRQAEAKAKLSGIFSAEKAFYADNNTYTACLKAIGFEPESTGQHYYACGSMMINAPLANCGPNKTQPLLARQSCLTFSYNVDGTSANTCLAQTGSTGYDANSAARSSMAVPRLYSSLSGSSFVQSDLFLMSAQGWISASGLLDQWSIDQNRVLNNDTPGI